MMPGYEGLRVPPHSEEAERAVLGSILLAPQQSLGKCVESGMSATDFYDRRHQALYESLIDMNSSSVAMDAVTIAEHLKNASMLEKVGGYDYLTHLQDTTIVPAHVNFYTDIVKDKSLKRQIIQESMETMDRAYRGEEDGLELLNEARATLFGLDMRDTRQLTNEEAADMAIDRWRRVLNGESFGLPWHVSDITSTFGNFQNYGNPYFIAGEPGAGKSVTMQGLLKKWGVELGKPVGCASLEMTKQKMMARFMTEHADVSMWALENGRYGTGMLPAARHAQAIEWIDATEEAKRVFAQAPIHINDKRMNIDEIVAYGLNLYERHGIEAYCIDHFQLTHPPSHKKLEGIAALEYKCDKLMDFSKNTGVITVALSQLTKMQRNRDGSSRPPEQDDLFGGRVIDAASEGTVIFYRRDDMDFAKVCKNRNGNIGTIEVFFNRPRLRFQNVDHHTADPIEDDDTPFGD